jgi:predicted nuclease of predicted toxin-antitoxin system
MTRRPEACDDVKLLIDECLHMSLVAVAETRGHSATHVNYLGLSGATDWDLMPRIVQDDFTFVTNNAKDFRKLYALEPIHAGLLIIIPQVPPPLQRQLFAALLDELALEDVPINILIEIEFDGSDAVIFRSALPE